MKEFEVSWLSDPEVFSVCELPPVSDHEIFADAEECARGASSLTRSLDGVWLAHFAPNPAGAPEELLRSDAMDASLTPVTVPGEFQLQNPDWDPPHYVNVQYPWDGHEELVPPQVSQTYNPTVTAVRTFPLSAEDLACGRVVLTFGAVEAAVALYVNGTFCGYAEDSFTPHRFDVTALVHAGENRLAARVFKRCTGSWMEDQDFWRFSGIHRSVTLTFEPETHLADLFVRTPLKDGWTRAFLEADLTVDRPEGTVGLALTADDGAVLFTETLPAERDVRFAREVPGVRLWSAEDPALYTLTVTLTGADGRVREVACTRVGFRSFELVDRVMCLNGRRIVFHGVNRHEFDCDRGRVMTRELLLRDIRDMKSMNVNAVRTCHYPNTTEFYRLCDEYGLYVIDETNVETHGSWARKDLSRVVPGDRPDWLEAVLARGRAMQERDKNHPCVLLWSCGNESYGGRDLWLLSEQFRRRDPGRLVHYEGVTHDTRWPDTTDVHSEMYAKAADIVRYLESDPEKPFISCEYTHAMGNSCGGMFLYSELEDRCPMYQGGFIWDYVDQGLRVPGPNGQTRLAYGGDFGDRPTDWHFNTNGLILGDRTFTPKVQEVRRLFSDVRITPDASGVTVTSRRVFAPLRGLDLVWSVLVDREPAREGVCALPAVAPGESVHVDLPFDDVDGAGEVIVTASLVTAQDGLLPRGTELAFGQSVTGRLPAPETPAPVPMVESDRNLGVRTGFMMARGEGLISLRDALGRETLLRAPRLSLFRAPTDNDRGNKDALAQGVWMAASLCGSLSEAEVSGGKAVWHWTSPLVPGMDAALTLTPMTDGLHAVLTWKAVQGQPDLPALGLSFPLAPDLTRVEYFGLGPDDCYADRCRGARLGWWSYPVREGWTRYARPQESGNRMGVDTFRVTREDGHGVEVSGHGLEVSCQPWLPEQLAACLHPDELAGASRTVLDVALFRRGVGGDDSWGAPVLPQFKYPSDRDWRLEFTLRGI